MSNEQRLRELIAKWRAKADLWDADPEYLTLQRPVSEVACANARNCADELEAALAATESQGEPDYAGGLYPNATPVIGSDGVIQTGWKVQPKTPKETKS